MEITSIFLAILSIMYVVLSARISLLRGEHGVSIGAGSNPVLSRAIRIQGNFGEYVPLLLIMIAMLEMLAAPNWFVWLFGVVVVAGRFLHAYGMWSPATPGWARIGGMACTYTPLIVGALYLLSLILL